MSKLQAPNVGNVTDVKSMEKVLQDILRTIYVDLNRVNDIISTEAKKATSSDASGSSGNVRVVNVGDKKYIEGKFKEGWSRVELTETS